MMSRQQSLSQTILDKNGHHNIINIEDIVHIQIQKNSSEDSKKRQTTHDMQLCGQFQEINKQVRNNQI